MKNEKLFARFKNIVDDGNTKMINSILGEHPEFLTEINYKDASGKTLLDYANSDDMKQALRQFGAKTSIEQSAEFKATKAAVEKELRKRSTRPEEEFIQAGDKSTGFTEGYVAKDRPSDLKDEEQQKTYMLKRAPKNRPNDNTRDLMIEYISAGLFSRVLGSRQAPNIALVVPETEITTNNLSKKTIKHDGFTKEIGLRSMFFEDFSTLAEKTKSAEPTVMTFSKEVEDDLKSVIGFEKVIAAMFALGEIDGHPGNVGVSEVIQEDGTRILLAKKIDHGRCMHKFETELYSHASGEIGHAENVTQYLNRINYDYDSINAMFDIVKFVKALDEVTQISEDEIRDIISQRVYDLYYLGMDFKVIADTYAFPMNNTQDPKELSEYLAANVLHQMEMCKQLRKGLVENGYVSEVDLKEDLSDKQLEVLDKGRNMFEIMKAKHELEAKKELTNKFSMVLNSQLDDVLPANTRFEYLDSAVLNNDGNQLYLRQDDSNSSQISYLMETLPENFKAEIVELDKMTKALKISLASVTNDDYSLMRECITSVTSSHQKATKVVLEVLLDKILPGASWEVTEAGIQVKVSENSSVELEIMLEAGKSIGFNFEKTDISDGMQTFVSKAPALSVDGLIESITKKIAIEREEIGTTTEFREKVDEERRTIKNTSIEV